MDYLVLSPPVCTPSEPPSGAFLLAAALTAKNLDIGFLDLSLEFYHRVFQNLGTRNQKSDVSRAVCYLQNSPIGYDPHKHRSVTGILNSALSRFSEMHQGWKLTLMDLIPPVDIHKPGKLLELSQKRETPFSDLWEEVLEPVLAENKPQKVLVSLAYLSQLPAAIDLCYFLQKKGIRTVTGGSLPRSFSLTGKGIPLLASSFPDLSTDDGSELIQASSGVKILDSLSWPQILNRVQYMSSRPIIPLTLSTGCFWNRCLFCPDRNYPFRLVPKESITGFLENIPPEIKNKKPVIHFLDSAIPPEPLQNILPVLKHFSLDFYGFARPSEKLFNLNLLSQMSDSGCIMLQFGIETGSKELLELFNKGLDPSEMERVLQKTASSGIKTYGYFLFGLPGEMNIHREKTLSFLKKNSSNLDFLNLSVFNLPCCSELTERAEEFDITFEDLSESEDTIRLYRPFRWKGKNTRSVVRRFINSELIKEPGIKEIFLRTPRWFRTAHMALMDIPGRSSPHI